MNANLRKYETLVLMNPDLEKEEHSALIKKLEDCISSNQGTVIKTEEWGKRPLAYEVKKKKLGFYVLFNYEGPPGLVAELERNIRINEQIYKYLTVSK